MAELLSWGAALSLTLSPWLSLTLSAKGMAMGFLCFVAVSCCAGYIHGQAPPGAPGDLASPLRERDCAKEVNEAERGERTLYS